METKKKPNYVKIIFIGLFFAYIILYVLNVTGYYNGNLRRKVSFTDEQIQQFESDVKNGEKVDLHDYLKDQEKNYTNNASNMGYTISTNVESFLNEGIKKFMNILSKLFT